MKILIPVTSFGRAGGLRVLSKLADEMISYGHSVHFLAPSGTEHPYYPTKAEILTFPDPTPKLRIIRILFRTFFLTTALHKKARQYDFVLANQSFTAIPVWLTTIGSLKGIYYIQAYEPDLFPITIWGKIGKIAAKISYKLDLFRIVNSNIYLNYCEIKATEVLEPGIDLSLFKAKRLEPKSTANKTLTFGCIGRSEKWKGTTEIIESVKMARDRFKKDGISIKLKVAFALPPIQEIQDPDFIELVQPHGDQNLAEFYNSVDVVIAIGLIQPGAFHYPTMEAMACGKPVITNYSPGSRDNCFYIEEVSPHSLFEAICESVIHPQLRAAFERNSPGIIEKYDWNKVGDKFEQILLSRLKQRN